MTAAVIEVDRVGAALRALAAAVDGLADAMVPEAVTRPSAELAGMVEPETMAADLDASTIGDARLTGLSLGPAELWQSTRMRLALGRHDWTTVFRLLQRHGVSQRKIATACQCSQSEVSEIIGGRRVTAWPVLARYATGLGVPHGWVGLAFDGETATFLALHPHVVGGLSMTEVS